MTSHEGASASLPRNRPDLREDDAVSASSGTPHVSYQDFLDDYSDFDDSGDDDNGVDEETYAQLIKEGALRNRLSFRGLSITPA